MPTKLPICYPPIVDCYAYEANIVSIAAIDSSWYPWLFTDFIGLRYWSDERYCSFDRAAIRCPFYNIIKVYNCDICHDIINILVEQINKNHYVLTPVDHYYISESSAYQSTRFVHDFALVYGYDLKEKHFYVADNFKQGKYTCLQIPFEQFIYAFQKDLPNYFSYFVDFNPNRSSISFDATRLATILECYNIGKQPYFDDYYEMNCINKQGHYLHNVLGYPHIFNDDKDIYGIHLYSILRQYLDSIKSDTSLYDIRGFHLVCNHKMILELMINYLYYNNFLTNYETIKGGIDQIKDLCLSIRNLMIRLSITNNYGLLPRIKEKINIVEKNEYNLLNLIIQDLY